MTPTIFTSTWLSLVDLLDQVLDGQTTVLPKYDPSC